MTYTTGIDSAFALSNLDGLDLLLVNDAGELFTTLSRACGAKVTAVRSAAEAFDALASSIPHVVISDVVLPDGDGYSFIHRVCTSGPIQNRGVPAIAVSGVVRAEEWRRASAAGFQACLAIQPSELAHLVRSLALPARG